MADVDPDVRAAFEDAFKQFDKDGDGKLSQEERDTAREAMKAYRTKGEKQQEKKKNTRPNCILDANIHL